MRVGNREIPHGGSMARQFRWIVAGMLAVVATGVPAFAAEVEAFLAGTAKSCIACDLAGRDLKAPCRSPYPQSKREARGQNV
jgi:hypothetical protein